LIHLRSGQIAEYSQFAAFGRLGQDGHRSACSGPRPRWLPGSDGRAPQTLRLLGGDRQSHAQTPQPGGRACRGRGRAAGSEDRRVRPRPGPFHIVCWTHVTLPYRQVSGGRREPGRPAGTPTVIARPGPIQPLHRQGAVCSPANARSMPRL